MRGSGGACRFPRSRGACNAHFILQCTRLRSYGRAGQRATTAQPLGATQRPREGHFEFARERTVRASICARPNPRLRVRGARSSEPALVVMSRKTMYISIAIHACVVCVSMSCPHPALELPPTPHTWRLPHARAGSNVGEKTLHPLRRSYIMYMFVARRADPPPSPCSSCRSHHPILPLCPTVSDYPRTALPYLRIISPASRPAPAPPSPLPAPSRTRATQPSFTGSQSSSAPAPGSTAGR